MATGQEGLPRPWRALTPALSRLEVGRHEASRSEPQQKWRRGSNLTAVLHGAGPAECRRCCPRRCAARARKDEAPGAREGGGCETALCGRGRVDGREACAKVVELPCRTSLRTSLRRLGRREGNGGGGRATPDARPRDSRRTGRRCRTFAETAVRGVPAHEAASERERRARATRREAAQTRGRT